MNVDEEEAFGEWLDFMSDRELDYYYNLLRHRQSQRMIDAFSAQYDGEMNDMDYNYDDVDRYYDDEVRMENKKYKNIKNVESYRQRTMH